MKKDYELITGQDRLEAVCREMAQATYVTIDTEFMRERTYWPQLCLVQIARPLDADGAENAVLIDPLAGLDLAPLFDLMRDPAVTKVFHAARQDVEIFVNLMGEVPSPIFDTQIAAMVCGFGDQAGYETLVRKLAGARLDKSSRFTDWARRPLSEKQLAYAAGDVTHLRVIYEKLAAQLEETGRAAWVASELETLRARETYVVEPEDAWRRIKTRSTDPRFLGVVHTLARWREATAQERDQPRGRILKDEAILEIAASRPTSREKLLESRALQREGRKPETLEAILAMVAEGVANPVKAPPAPERARPKAGGQALADLLRVLLKAKADDLGVAQRLIASAADLDALAHEETPEVKALNGWRREAFGEDAIRLRRGEIALSAGEKGVRIVPVESGT
ncbi:ribonuclease D [Pikeienuella piscinae]|uniref:Ribonuclease D n=1 Tax=Pikeienuella piscinae TaxID=2748098 RepID=A0A7L5BSP4_9RHOB|nr:ribonuclease D [Pikeienuella piscinae]QIE54590.1 ribonuclease D [Pikeienuella piscinae]